MIYCLAAQQFQLPLKNKNVPAFGAVWFTANVITDLDKRTYDLENVKVTKVKFGETSSEEEKEFDSMIGTTLPQSNLHGSLDNLLATLANTEKEKQIAESLQTTPPKIIFLKYPAQLVLLDGDPKLQPIENSKLMRVVNTPMLMVFDPDSKKYYLSSGIAWYSTNDIKKDWQINYNPPTEITNMLTLNGKQVQNTISEEKMPKIIVATEPTELIVSDGEPQYSPIQDTNLLYMSNSNNDVFMDIESQMYYVLLSGRWYTSKSLDGEWSYVPGDKLPPDFAKILRNHQKVTYLLAFQIQVRPRML